MPPRSSLKSQKSVVRRCQCPPTGSMQVDRAPEAFSPVRCIYRLPWDYPQLAKGKHGPSSQAELVELRDQLLRRNTATPFIWLCHFVYGIEGTGL